MSEDRLFAAWVLSATTGLRRGELLGLRWKDVELDSDRPHIVVRQALKVVDYEPVFGPVKYRVRDAGLTKIRLHDVRHSYATALLEARVPVKVVSERLGHSTTQITQDLYQHVLEGWTKRPHTPERPSSSGPEADP